MSLLQLLLDIRIIIVSRLTLTSIGRLSSTCSSFNRWIMGDPAQASTEALWKTLYRKRLSEKRLPLINYCEAFRELNAERIKSDTTGCIYNPSFGSFVISRGYEQYVYEQYVYEPWSINEDHTLDMIEYAIYYGQVDIVECLYRHVPDHIVNSLYLQIAARKV